MLFLTTVELCPVQHSKGNAEYCKVEQGCGKAQLSEAAAKQ